MKLRLPPSNDRVDVREMKYATAQCWSRTCARYRGRDHSRRAPFSGAARTSPKVSAAAGTISCTPAQQTEDILDVDTPDA